MSTMRATALTLGLLLRVGDAATAQEFYGEVLLKPIDGVIMEVQQPFGFIDARNRKWEVPARFRTDGASIPRPLWGIVGSPFTGNYIAASIIHDFYCDLKSRQWQDVHSVFYEAMIAKRVDSVQAKVMYYAVYRFGPRWIVDKNFVCPPHTACQLAPGAKPTRVGQVTVNPAFDEAEFRKMTQEIRAGNISLGKIRSTADASFYNPDQLFAVKGDVTAKGEHLAIDQRARLGEVPGLQGSLEYFLKLRE